ncbi:glycine/betaine ABC transporter substrate-binding protein [Carnobacteriaceae bacterium zg-ZUI252]|nr:glycine/betaine ABC transporter substrate-binding protein [Carnobacteriaceae bacterium zg-ZUI252]MBS4770623.1 glycine/betaine ABC transporter substrate-binding protein [Carnobacteriaceae bacterium zg-ZUI240]
MNIRKLFSTILLCVMTTALIGLVVFDKNSTTPQTTQKNQIRIGSKDFTENVIVSEIYAQALEYHGYSVTRVQNIASSVIHNAIVNDEIDLYPEYTGTGLLSILKEQMQTDPLKVYETVKAQYEQKFQLMWLNYASANDGQGLVIRTQVARELNIKTISDLQQHANQLRFASQGEFDQREDGIVGLTKVYGPFQWKANQVYDNSLKYKILENDQADVTPAYTTEGQLVNTQTFTVLEDDKQFWPPYNLAPVVRRSTLQNTPEIADILNKVSAHLDTQTMTTLNAKVDVEGQDYAKVAKEYFESIKNGL